MTIFFFLLLAFKLLNFCVTKLCRSSQLHLRFSGCENPGDFQWLLKVPRQWSECILTQDSIPIPVSTCNPSCPIGHFFDVDNSKCAPCPAGSYSEGTSVSILKWISLRKEFSAESVSFNKDLYACHRSGWFPQDHYLFGRTETGCMITLSMIVNIVKDGEVSFTYNLEDYYTVATFTVRNERCVVFPNSSIVLPTTGHSTYRAKLKLSEGRSVLQWQLYTEMHTLRALLGISESALLLKTIKVSGTPSVFRCNVCPPGTFSNVSGLAACIPCPADTYSQENSKQCNFCEAASYSAPGSASCTKRLHCVPEDYLEEWSACDENNLTYNEYVPMEPKICDDRELRSVPENKISSCSPCPLGTEPANATHCKFCLLDQHSSASTCLQCGEQQEPLYGLLYTTWSRWPPNVVTTCYSLFSPNCRPWMLNNGYIVAGPGNGVNTIAILKLSVPDGFLSRDASTSDLNDFHITNLAAPTFRLRFEAELSCQSQCQLILQQNQGLYKNVTLGIWNTSQNRVNYTFSGTSFSPAEFVWIFQKLDSNSLRHPSRLPDKVRIYEVELSNVKSAGIIGCNHCYGGTHNGRCIPCPQGQFYTFEIDVPTQKQVVKCVPCPPNTIVLSDASFAHISEACLQCPAGTKDIDNIRCVIDPALQTADGTIYNITDLLNTKYTVNGVNLFTPEGSPYNYVFELTLAYGTTVHCVENVTGSTQHDVESLICRHTKFPAHFGEGNVVYSQPISLGTILKNALQSNHSMRDWILFNRLLREAGWKEDTAGTDVHIRFEAHGSTPECPSGRNTLLTLRCDPGASHHPLDILKNQTERQFLLELPPNCPSGTCDGCLYQFLLTSTYACPFCAPQHVGRFYGECSHGVQKVYLYSLSNCQLPSDMPIAQVSPCPLLSTVESVALVVGLLALVVLLGIIFSCNQKNKKLQYKYMKLVQRQSGVSQPTSCTLDESEDSDDISKSPFTFNRELILTPARLTHAFISKLPFTKPEGHSGPLVLRRSGNEDTAILSESEVRFPCVIPNSSFG